MAIIDNHPGVIPEDADPTAMYTVPGSALVDIADAIRLKRDSAAPIAVEDMPLEIGLIEGIGVGQLPGKTVEITGACFIYVGDLGESGFAVRIDNGFTGDLRPCFFTWGTSGTDGSISNQLAIWNRNARFSTATYPAYFRYNEDSQTFFYSGSTLEVYDLRGVWQFIPVE